MGFMDVVNRLKAAGDELKEQMGIPQPTASPTDEERKRKYFTRGGEGYRDQLQENLRDPNAKKRD